MKNVVEILKNNNKTISTMESCTGGGLANAITNIEGASSVIKYSAVTYSNEYKIKMGVNEETISKFSVYSMEVANEMSKCISNYSNSEYGVGITGQINRADPNNIVDNTNKIYVSIYDKNQDKFYNKVLNAIDKDRSDNKQYIVKEVSNMLLKIFNEV